MQCGYDTGHLPEACSAVHQALLLQMQHAECSCACRAHTERIMCTYQASGLAQGGQHIKAASSRAIAYTEGLQVLKVQNLLHLKADKHDSSAADSNGEPHWTTRPQEAFKSTSGRRQHSQQGHTRQGSEECIAASMLSNSPPGLRQD